MPDPLTIQTQHFADIRAVVEALRPEQPVFCVRPHALRAAARRFLDGFPGRVLYAVKCNAEPAFLGPLHEAGIVDFDVASLPEIEQVSALDPPGHGYFMNPVKRRGDIAAAYRDHGIRHFVADHPAEIDKIRAETVGAKDITLLVRLATAHGAAVYDLGGKFGVGVEAAADLLRIADKLGWRIGLCFHVGSQCLEPRAYVDALKLIRSVRRRFAAPLAVVDVGGGFPASYSTVQPPPLETYFDVIRHGYEALKLPADCALWCEPGRALVASGASLLVKVELRRGRQLYLNDGLFGSLSDFQYPAFLPPMRAIRPGAQLSDENESFVLFGPTCDSEDVMKGPYSLPADIAEGDWIEIGQWGAYSSAFRTRFNGFYADRFVTVDDPPFMPMHAPIVSAAAE
jgi:ornithine decarboxylase